MAKPFNADTATLSQFRVEIKSLVTAIGKTQDRIHNLCIGASIQWLKHDNPDWAIELIASLNPLGGSIRVQAVCFWFKEAVGLTVNIDPKTGAVTAKKNGKFNWDREITTILGYGRANPYYKLAPTEKPLSAELPKPDSFAVMCARALESGTASEEDVAKLIASLQGMVDKKRKDPKIGAWVKEYNAQIASVASH